MPGRLAPEWAAELTKIPKRKRRGRNPGFSWGYNAQRTEDGYVQILGKAAETF